MRRTLSTTVVGVMTLSALALSPGTAVADDAFTSSTNGAAQAWFEDYGEHLYACDMTADGNRAVAIAQWSGGAREVQDTDGANGNCAGHANLDIPEGYFVEVTACVRNGASGALYYCRTVVGVA